MTMPKDLAILPALVGGSVVWGGREFLYTAGGFGTFVLHVSWVLEDTEPS